MKTTARLLSALLMLILTIALAIVPMITITASAEEATVSFSVPQGVTAVADITATNGKITLPSVDESKTPDYTFVGWAEVSVNNQTTAPTIYAAGSEYEVSASTTLYAVYSISSGYNLVTDASALAAGDRVIIAAAGNDFAMSKTQNNNNRGQADIAKIDNSVTFGDDVCVFTLVTGKVDNTFAFYDTALDKYLYAASSSSNYLKSGDLNENASFKITINNGATSIVAQGSYTRNDLRYNKSSKLFSCYASSSTMAAVCLYKFDIQYTTSPEVTSCQHTNTTENTIPATCTVTGAKEVVCRDCGYVVSSTEIAVLGHSYTSVTTPAACNAKGLITYACGREGCGHSYTEETAFLAHSFADGACSVCGMKEIDESALYAIMVRRNESVTYRFITSTLTDSSTKRFVAIDSGLTELIADGSYVASEIAFKFVENDDGSYYIYSPYIDDDAKYVGWTSGNSAALVNEAAARRVNVLPNGEGGYTFIMADTGRYFALNSTASNDYAAWYESEQANNLQLISVNVCTEHSGGEADCENLAKCETCGTAYGELDAEEHIEKLTGASVNIGADLSIKYYVDLCEHKDVTSYSMKFVMNGKETVVTAYIEVNGEYVFTFSGIAPQCMSDNIEAYLYAGDELVDSVTEYSIKKYAEKLLASGLTDKAKRLVTDMLYYGAAAQEYKGYNTENLATDGVANIGGASTATVTETGKSVEGQSEALNFTAAGVRFDYVNKIYAKFYAADINSVTVTVNDVDVTDMVEALGDNVYVIYTEAISAVNFNTSSVIVITDGENTATLTYSVNDYAYNMANSATASEGMKKLAKALYRYGRAAANYNN